MKTLLHISFLFLLVTQFCSAQWFQQNSGTTANLNSIHFIDANIGWAVGDSGKILHTTNAGQEWIMQMSGTLENLYDIIFYDTDKGTIVGDAGTILRTTNAGITWVQITIGAIPLRSVSFIDENNGWAAGENAIIKTTDGGNIWTIQTVDTTAGFLYIKYFNSLIGLEFNSTGWGGIIGNDNFKKTTNGGMSWFQQLSYRTIFSAFFLSEDIGWVSHWSNYSFFIIKTIDGGANWFIQDSNSVSNVKDIFFTNQNNGWVIQDDWDGGFCGIKSTADGGNNWHIQLENYPQDLISICFVDENNGWVVGENGTILHTTNGGVSFVQEEQIDEIPTEFLLSQNYPNPFNPSTTIKYSVPSVTLRQAQSDILVSLKVYDILGNEIETLVNEEKPAGTYEITWHAANLPSGVYFYQLKAVDPSTGSGQVYVETKKMLLLK